MVPASSPSVAGRATAAPPRAPLEAEALTELGRDEVNLVSWRRELPSYLSGQLEEWASRCPAHFEATIIPPRDELSAATTGLDEPARGWLAADLAALLERFARVTGAPRLRVSFGAVRTDQCRKFHVDYVHYRLVTTYVGPGTEWVPDHAVSRAALEHPPGCPCDANKEIVRMPQEIRHAAPGEVLVMKGARHPTGRGAVHRSPPIQGTGKLRVVLIASTLEGR